MAYEASAPTEQRDTLIAELRQDLEKLEAQYQSFRRTVRETAIRVAGEQNWCRDGLNNELIILGLDPANREYEIILAVQLSAKNEDAAFEELDNKIGCEYSVSSISVVD